MKPSGNELAVRLCGVLGIDPTAIRGLTIRAYAGETATIAVERVAHPYDRREIEHLLATYELASKAEPSVPGS